MKHDEIKDLSEAKSKIEFLEKTFDKTLSTFESNFEKMFDKLDNLMQRQSVYEEKVLNIMDNNLNIKKSTDKNREDLEKLKVTVINNEKTLNFFARILWIVIAALISALFKIFFYKQ